MATWEVGTRSLARPRPRGPAVAAVQALLAAGAVVLAGAGPYWALRASLGNSQVRAAARVLEVAPALRPSPAVAQAPAPAGPAGGRSVGSAGAPRVIFGRFASPREAQARARLVRRKGYIASVVRVGGAYAVVSRPYPSLEAARSWAEIFREIGLRSQVVPRLEAFLSADGS